MKEINRKNSNDRRWNLKYLKEKYGSDESFIASQLTDLDFPTPNFIFRQIIRRCRFKSLSYIVLDDEYYQSIIKWYKIRKNVELKQEWINYCYGELLGIVAIIRQISHVGAKFVITSPVRSALPKICTFNYREVIFNELQIKNNKFEFDFNALNEQLRDPMVKAFLLCNPMNPGGKLWTVEELTKIANICYQNNVILISDESGGDLLTNAQGFNSVLNLSDQKLFNNVIVCTTPSKGFNIGGLATGYFICPNQELRQKIYQYYQKNWLYEGDIFGTEVTKAVYSAKGAKWIDKLHLIFQENYKIIECFIWENHLPLTIMAMPSSFATVILINDDKKTLAFYKKRFFQEKLLVKFNDDFYDLKNKWFRLVLSCSNKTINEFLIRLKRIFK